MQHASPRHFGCRTNDGRSVSHQRREYNKNAPIAQVKIWLGFNRTVPESVG
jgi:hypothetical protein